MFVVHKGPHYQNYTNLGSRAFQMPHWSREPFPGSLKVRTSKQPKLLIHSLEKIGTAYFFFGTDIQVAIISNKTIPAPHRPIASSVQDNRPLGTSPWMG